jgi:hypothetical protein
MKFFQLGSGEYLLTVEENIRCSVRATIGQCIDMNGEKIAGIILEHHIKNKDVFKDADSKICWEAAKDGSAGIEKIFLIITFRDNNSNYEGKMNFYFDLNDPYFSDNMIDWFKLIIGKNGLLALFDGEEPSVFLHSVPLDMPKLIISGNF